MRNDCWNKDEFLCDVYVTTFYETQRLKVYGKEEPVVVKNVPIKRCSKCNEEWMDHEAEALRTKAILENCKGR